MPIYGVAIDAFYGVRQKRVYVMDHEGDGFFPIQNKDKHEYIAGNRPADYPVPAIRQHYEFGWSLSKSEPVLMHVYSSPYPS